MALQQQEVTRLRPVEPIGKTKDSRPLRFFYRTLSGRLFLRLVVSRRPFSRLVGWYQSSRLSRSQIKGFVQKNGIDLSEYLPMQYRSFNEFFTRPIRPECRPIDDTPAHLIAPCDARLTAYPITEERIFQIKDAVYTVSDLVQSPELAAEFAGGICLIFRLCVDNYHRYCCFDSGRILAHHKIKGVLHTVRPIALERYNFYAVNQREVTVFESESFGKSVQVEVGALCIGKIINHKEEGSVLRGEEKGYFAFGGSTVVLLLKKDAAVIDADILGNTKQSCETLVRLGEKIGVHP